MTIPATSTSPLPPPAVQRLDALDDDDLGDFYGYPHDLDRAYLRANFVTSLDGAVTGEDGLSASLGSAVDRRVFALLRALCDVVLVGAGTARAEGYHRVQVPAELRPLRERLGLAPAPTLAVVSASLDLPETVLDTVLETADAGPVVVVTCGGAAPERVAQVRELLGSDAVLQAGTQRIDIADAVEQLAARGLHRILLEGGPRLMGEVVEAGLLDELCLTLSPVVVGGDGPRLLAGPPASMHLRLAHVLESDGVLLTRWVSR